MNTPTSGLLPPGIRPIKIKYSTVCRCGKTLRKSQSAFYDTTHSKPLCKFCLKQLLKAGAFADAGEVTKDTITEIKQLLSIPVPRSNSVQGRIVELIEQLRSNHASISECRNLLVEYYEINLTRSSRCIVLNYETSCMACGLSLQAKTAAIWDSASRRTWCFPCASLMPIFQPSDQLRG